MSRNADRTNVRYLVEDNGRESDLVGDRFNDCVYPSHYPYRRNPTLEDYMFRDELEVFETFAGPWLARANNEAQ